MKDLKRIYAALFLCGLGATLIGISSVVSDIIHGYRFAELQKRVERLEQLADKLAPYLEAGK